MWLWITIGFQKLLGGTGKWEKGGGGHSARGEGEVGGRGRGEGKGKCLTLQCFSIALNFELRPCGGCRGRGEGDGEGEGWRGGTSPTAFPLYVGRHPVSR